MVQNDKKLCLSRSISHEPYIIWFSFLVHLCNVTISTGILCNFSKFWFSRLLKGQKIKGQKLVQNDKKFCLSCSISQEPYIVWLSFVVCKCKMIISSGFFVIFSKFWFFRFLGGSKGKKWPKMTKNSVVHYISGIIHHMIFIYVARV